MKKLTAFYFTGTGNTRYVTLSLMQKLTGAFETRAFEIPGDFDAASELKGADAVLLAFPIYGSSPPVPMRRFLQKNSELFRGKEVMIAATQYMFSGDGAASLGRAVERVGGRVTFAEHFNMPNNLADCGMFRIRNGRELEGILRKTDRRIDRFARRILCGKIFRRGFNPVSHAVGYFCQRSFWRRSEEDKKSLLKIDAKKCVGCGLCVKNCPVRNLGMDGKRARAKGNCALCYRCVNLCPKRAISLVGNRAPEVQYRGPNIGAEK